MTSPKCQTCQRPMKGHPRKEGKLFHANPDLLDWRNTVSHETRGRNHVDLHPPIQAIPIQTRTMAATPATPPRNTTTGRRQALPTPPTTVRQGRARGQDPVARMREDIGATGRTTPRQLPAARDVFEEIVYLSISKPSDLESAVSRSTALATLAAEPSFSDLNRGQARLIEGTYKSTSWDEVQALVKSACDNNLKAVIVVSPQGHPKEGPWHVTIGGIAKQEKDKVDVGGQRSVAVIWKEMAFWKKYILCVLIFNLVRMLYLDL